MFGAFTPALLLAWNSSQVREPSPLDSPAPIFVINLEARYDKWRATVDSTLNAGLRNARLVRWPGVFFNRSTADERTVGWLSRPAQRGKWSQLDLGMAGLRLAHVSAWNEIATTRSDDEYAIIVEDDIEFLRHSFACTAQCVAAAGAFDVINLRAIRPSGTPVAGAPGMLRVEKLKWPGK